MQRFKILICITGAVICGLFLSAPVKAVPVSRLQLSDTAPYVGDTLELLVIVDGVTDFDPVMSLSDEVIAFGFDVVYDPAGFNYNGAVVGPLFNDDSAFFADTDVAGSTFPGVIGDNILLAGLSFTSLTAGSYSLGIRSDLFDINEGLITCMYLGIDLTGEISVKAQEESTTVPEPGTIFLLAFGMLGLAGFRKRSQRITDLM